MTGATVAAAGGAARGEAAEAPLRVLVVDDDEVDRLLAKLGAANRTEAAAVAHRLGLA